MSNLWLCPRCDTHFVPLKKRNRNGAGLSVPTPRSGCAGAHPVLRGIHYYPSQNSEINYRFRYKHNPYFCLEKFNKWASIFQD